MPSFARGNHKNAGGPYQTSAILLIEGSDNIGKDVKGRNESESFLFAFLRPMIDGNLKRQKGIVVPANKVNCLLEYSDCAHRRRIDLNTEQVKDLLNEIIRTDSLQQNAGQKNRVNRLLVIIVDFNPIAIGVLQVNLVDAIGTGCNGRRFSGPIFIRQFALL